MSAPTSPAPGSYVKVTRLRDGSWAVFSYDRTSPFTVALNGRWWGASEEAALLHAQRFVAMGYTLRSMDLGASEKGARA